MSTFLELTAKVEKHVAKMKTNELFQALLTGKLGGVVGIVINELEERLNLTEEQADEAYAIYFTNN